MPSADLSAAASAVDAARAVVATGVEALAAAGGPDVAQVLAYDVAHSASAVGTASALLDCGARGDVEARFTCAFGADAVADLAARIWERESVWGVDRGALDGAAAFVAEWRDPSTLADLAGDPGPRHLDGDFELVQDTFRRFADDRLKAVAEHIHRHN